VGEDAGDDYGLGIACHRFNGCFACDDGLIAPKMAVQGHDEVSQGECPRKGVGSV